MAMLLAATPVAAQTSPNGVKPVPTPPGMPDPVGTWGLGSRAGDFVFLAGVQGYEADGSLSPDPETRIRRAFTNIQRLAESQGASLRDCVRVTVYLSDLHRYAGIVDRVQAEIWGKPPYPPRTMMEVQRLFQDDIIEIDTVFYAPQKK
jgi:enamine deaminase RidA (YjgF/YER057c/UK114 family)